MKELYENTSNVIAKNFLDGEIGIKLKYPDTS